MATSGQHVGGLRDSLTGDDMSAARAQAAALARLARPTAAKRRNEHQLGNGDVCPRVPEHGKMYVLSTGTQWCPDQSHDAERIAGTSSPARPALPELEVDL